MIIICDYHGRAMGKFCVRIGELFFPSQDWEDFCIPIVSDWISVVSNCCTESTFKMYFMDGPYYLQCNRKNENVIINAVDDHTGSIVTNDTTSFRLLQIQLIETAKMLLKSNNNSNCMENDFKSLDNVLRSFEQSLVKPRHGP